jgi:hypothetical protein
LPSEWNELNLKNIHAFNSVFNISIKRVGEKLRVSVLKDRIKIFDRMVGEGNEVYEIIFLKFKNIICILK